MSIQPNTEPTTRIEFQTQKYTKQTIIAISMFISLEALLAGASLVMAITDSSLIFIAVCILTFIAWLATMKIGFSTLSRAIIANDQALIKAELIRHNQTDELDYPFAHTTDQHTESSE